MAKYADGFILPLPRKNVEAYREIADRAGRVWRDHGALEYRECIGEDLDVEGVVPFTRSVELREDEVVVLAWIVFESRAHRDAVNSKVMEDPRMSEMDVEGIFDSQRMVYGGFELLVDRGA